MFNNLILLQTGLIPIWVYDLETFFILDINESAVLQYGYSAEEFKSLTIYDLNAPTEFERLNDSLHELNSENEKLYKEVFTHVKKNGVIGTSLRLRNFKAETTNNGHNKI